MTRADALPCMLRRRAQAGERPAPDNPYSCSKDCLFPYVACPPFVPGAQPCNGRGVCFTSLGACK